MASSKVASCPVPRGVLGMLFLSEVHVDLMQFATTSSWLFQDPRVEGQGSSARAKDLTAHRIREEGCRNISIAAARQFMRPASACCSPFLGVAKQFWFGV